MRRPRVLVVADYYLPGFRGGGPVRAISNAIGRLASDVDFFVVTRDHDADGTTHAGVESGRWVRGASACLYAPRLTPRVLEQCVAESACDAIWLNSFFSRASMAILLLRRMGRLHQPVLLAPRGEFAPGALARKPRRKAVVRQLLRRTGCLRSIRWLAASEIERADIARAVGAQHITCVPETVAPVPVSEGRWAVKSAGRLRVVFASRIMPTKNLLFLLEVLARADGDIRLDIIGPLEDAGYWASCQAAMRRLPPNVTAAYAGEMPHDDLQRRLAAYDLLVLPTHGDSFGHVIVEAWAAGCPVLISDRTPWRRLREAGVGWDVPLEHGAWTAALSECLALGPAAHQGLRQRARAHARRVWDEGVKGADDLGRMFDAARSSGAEPLEAAPMTEPCA